MNNDDIMIQITNLYVGYVPSWLARTEAVMHGWCVCWCCYSDQSMCSTAASAAGRSANGYLYNIL